MKKVCLSVCALLLAVAAAAQGPPVLAKSKLNAPKSSITVSVNGINCATAAGSNQFAVEAWSWGASNPVTIGGAGGGSGAGKASVSSLNLMKHFDQCSPALFEGVVTGKHFNSAVLTQQDSDGNVLLTVSLTGVFVESWQLSGSTGDASPSESVSLAFQKVCVAEPSTSSKVCFDLTTNSTQ